MYKRVLFITLLLSMITVACSKQTPPKEPNFDTDNPTPAEILANNPDADIFLRNGIVYTNAENIEWVQEEDLSLGEVIGEIKKQTNNSEEFENYTATKLPVGSLIYEPFESKGSLILIVKVDQLEIRYLGLIEG